MAADPQVSTVDTGLGKQPVSTLSPGRYSREQLRANLLGNVAKMMRYVSTAWSYAGEDEIRIDKDLGGCEDCLLKIELIALYLYESEENSERLG